VLIPQENVKDLQEIPDEVKAAIEIVPVRWFDEVLDRALERKPMPITDEAVAPAPVVAPEVRPALIKH
jgi:ATP-dependent Lon protease